jgi:fibronectin-binding autotransporter adhesin
VGNIVDNAALIFNRSNALTYGGVISGTGTVQKLGAGTLTLTGDSTYTGTTTISAGSLQVGNGGTTGSIVGNVVDNAALIFNRSNALTYGGVISGTGTLQKLGAGALTGSPGQTRPARR